MMGLDNPLHIGFLLVILLLVFGAKRLPEMGRSLGSGLRGFKDSLSDETHTTHLSSGVDTTQLDSAVDTTHLEGLTANHADAGPDIPAPDRERSPVGRAA